MMQTGWLTATSPAVPDRASRWSGAVGVSLLFHALLALALLGIFSSRAAQDQLRSALDTTKLVYVAATGGGGGGGGNPRPSPPQPTEIPPHPLTTPVPVEQPPAIAPEPTPQPALYALVETNAATALQFAGISANALRGPGGGGPGDGAGPGRGRGLGPGEDRGVGDGLYQVGGDVLTPALIRKVDPAYTGTALQTKTTGEVQLEVVVLANGTVGRVKVVKSLSPDLDAEAIKAARQWLFRPATKNGKPVDVLVTLVLTFVLH